MNYLKEKIFHQLILERQKQYLKSPMSCGNLKKENLNIERKEVINE